MVDTNRPPNFLIIVADDLGFSDTGPYGSEIQTPALDRLARDGVRFTNFHTASACSPTRAMLFSGTDNHIAGLGQMEEQIRQRPDLYKDRPGYEGYLNWRVAALSEILQDAGYLTLMSGKWHLGLKRELSPHARGFSKSFSFLPGAGNHFNYEPQLDPDNHGAVPKLPFMWTDGFWMEDDQYIDRRALPAEFYSSKFFTDRLLSYLENRSDNEKTQPFFAYLPFTAPHWPLQAPQESIRKYKGSYDGGPSALREQRLRRLVDLGLVPADVTPAPIEGLRGKEWEELSPEERAVSARKMEVYAAMVDVMDQQIGRLTAYLEATGEMDNTFVLFMSDNGAEGKLLEAIPMMGGQGTLSTIIDTFYNNELENIGSHDSFTWYGPRWACAATAPSRGFKTWITEGGIRCPCIVRYPPLTRGAQESISHSFATVMDILPTVLELARVSIPCGSFRGRDIVPVRGQSWVRHLGSMDYAKSSIHDEDNHVTGWELFGSCAIRRGHWKAVWMPSPRGKEKWELYNLQDDPGEINDQADTMKDLLAELIQEWEHYYAATGMFEVGTEFGVLKG